MKQKIDRENDRTKHEHGLDEIGPNDGLDSTDGGVNRGDHGNEYDAPDVDVEIDREIRKEITPNNHHDRSAKVKTHTDTEHPGEEENPARHVFRFRAETDGEELVNALHAVIVVGLDESVGDDDPRQDRADNELPVEIAARLKSFGRRPQKSSCACFRCDDGSKHGPPRDGAGAERKIVQVAIAPTCPKANRDDAEKVCEQHHRV